MCDGAQQLKNDNSTESKSCGGLLTSDSRLAQKRTVKFKSDSTFEGLAPSAQIGDGLTLMPKISLSRIMIILFSGGSTTEML
jgi:hypothetical protein